MDGTFSIRFGHLWHDSHHDILQNMMEVLVVELVEERQEAAGASCRCDDVVVRDHWISH